MKKKIQFLAVLILVCAFSLQAAAAQTGRSWRIFSKNENTWVYHPKGLMLFSSLSRTVKPVTIDAVRAIDTLTDCIDYDGYLWVSCNAGLYQVDGASQSVERIPLPGSDSTAMGKIAQDADYMWLGTTEKLLQFDKLGREWFTFELPQAMERIVGLWSNGDEVFCIGNKVLYRFTTSTEKWNTYPLEQPFGNDAIFYPGTGVFKVIDGKMVYLYQPASFSWQITDLGELPVDIYDRESELYCNFGGNKVKLINCSNGMVQPYNIPNIEGVQNISLTGDSLLMVQEKRVSAYSLTGDIVNVTEFENGKKISGVEKILPLQEFIVMITAEEIVVYEKKTKAWQYIKRSGMEQKVQKFSWNEEECALRPGNGVKSVMSGNIEMNMALKSDGYEYDTTYGWEDRGGSLTWVEHVDSQSLLKLVLPEYYGNVTLHSSDKNDRVADLFFKNSSSSTAPVKGVYYRGNKDDYLNTLKVGTTDNEQMTTELLPKVDMEGGSVVFESRQRLEKRDRKVARLAGGAGYITSRTITTKLPYRADGTYYLLNTGSDSVPREKISIIPGSMRVIVDGAVLDTTYYNLYNSIGKLQFNTSTPIDPVSALTVEYQVEPLPNGSISDVEIIPSSHFGKLQYGTATVSPTEWVSAKIGYTGIDRDTLHQIITASTPLELRNDKTKMMLKATPEFSYNVFNGSKAGGATLQSRLGGKTGVLFNTRFADDNFVSTDTLTTGLGALRFEYDAAVNHDLRQELPLSYYQHQRYGENGAENRFEFKSGVHYTNFPFLDLTMSRTVFDKNDDEDELNVFDSMFHKKDKLQLRLYETSARKLEKITGFNKIAYEIQHSEYRSTTQNDNTWNSGRVSTLQFTLIPIQRIVLLGEMLYRGSMEMEGAPSADIIPRISFQLIDVPKGVDVSGYYFVNNKRYWSDQLSTDTITRSVKVVFRPGQWWAPLGWFTPRAQLTQNIQTLFGDPDPTPWQVLTGDDGLKTRDIIREVGVNIFPSDGMTFTNTNRWSESSLREGYRFATVNRMQLVFNSRNIVTATYNYTGEDPYYVQNGLLMYEKTWTSWLRTSPAAMMDAKKDSTGSLFSAGPKLTVNLNFQDLGILRMLNNMYDVKVSWNKAHGELHSVPDVSYNFSLRLKLKPNLELSNDELLQFKEGKYDDFVSRLNLFVYF